MLMAQFVLAFSGKDLPFVTCSQSLKCIKTYSKEVFIWKGFRVRGRRTKTQCFCTPSSCGELNEVSLFHVNSKDVNAQLTKSFQNQHTPPAGHQPQAHSLPTSTKTYLADKGYH